MRVLIDTIDVICNVNNELIDTNSNSSLTCVTSHTLPVTSSHKAAKAEHSLFF